LGWGNKIKYESKKRKRSVVNTQLFLSGRGTKEKGRGGKRYTGQKIT